MAAERERLVAELTEALSKIKTLSGLIPICSGCKSISSTSPTPSVIAQGTIRCRLGNEGTTCFFSFTQASNGHNAR